MAHDGFVARDQSEQSLRIVALNDYCKLELTWILSQICLASPQSINVMLQPTAEGRQPILEHIVDMLDSGKWDQLEQVLWLLGNLTAECKLYGERIEQLDLCRRLAAICEAEVLL